MSFATSREAKVPEALLVFKVTVSPLITPTKFAETEFKVAS